MSRSDKLKLLELLEEKQRRTARNRLQTYFSTPEVRAEYAKQMQWFEECSRFNECALFGGNRCLTPWTVISTDRGERQVLEVCGEGSFGVQTWDGATRQSAQSTGVFLKGIEPAFRIHLDNGEVFECSRQHRVLTTVGFQPISLLMSRADVQHWSRTLSGWTASYAAGDRQHDPQLLTVLDSDPSLLQLPDDAQNIFLDDLHLGAAARTHKHNHVCRAFDPRAIQDDQRRLSGRFGISEWSAPIAPPSDALKFPQGRFGGKSLEYKPLAPVVWQHARLQAFSQTCSSDVWLPHYPIPLVGGNSILAVAAIGSQPIVDFEVPGTHNYIAAGAVHHNSGKTIAGTYQDTLHLTGMYPDWWPGPRFKKPTDGWAAGDTGKNVRDILQATLCGKPGDEGAQGTGMIPGDLILRTTTKHGLADAFETIFVRHVPTGGVSSLQLKSYDQGRVAFQGTSQDFIHLDEEPPLAVYAECLLRTMTTNGLITLTATPMEGLTQLMLEFLPHLKPADSKELDAAVKQ
jgi:phage terminase large subunit-like protein